MSAEVRVEPVARPGGDASPLSKWARQTAAVCALELRRAAFGKRVLLVYLLAGLPVLIAAALAAFPPTAAELRDAGTMVQVIANVYEGLVLRTVVFFGAAWVFMNLFRGEIVDRSLHYYFLTAVRREILVAGKFLAGLVITILVFSMTTLGTIFFLHVPMGGEVATRYLTGGGGLGDALAYVLITALACAGYGAVFLAVGLFFRNPILPALVVYGWETINFLLPPILKTLSVIYYLHSLAPTPIPEGPFSLVAEPVGGVTAVLSLVAFALAVLVLAARRIRRMEVSYAADS